MVDAFVLSMNTLLISSKSFLPFLCPDIRKVNETLAFSSFRSLVAFPWRSVSIKVDKKLESATTTTLTRSTTTRTMTTTVTTTTTTAPITTRR